ncbi:hypothetical protein [Gordonia crocea]|uniref:Uncharacterized protein n=1 Tax=Gordonia crocea TaxID=589162 RepID=A0A7I9UXJ4_9ACTN|nr:hypothetical protein [Gordonia crocea]GED97540.1 hypothetical protein nbrc107697_15790 [Gordonia crocea]
MRAYATKAVVAAAVAATTASGLGLTAHPGDAHAAPGVSGPYFEPSNQAGFIFMRTSNNTGWWRAARWGGIYRVVVQERPDSPHAFDRWKTVGALPENFRNTVGGVYIKHRWTKLRLCRQDWSSHWRAKTIGCTVELTVYNLNRAAPPVYRGGGGGQDKNLRAGGGGESHS